MLQDTARMAGIGVGTFLTTAAINQLSVPFFSVPLTVLTMAAGGAFFSFAYGDPVTPRKKLYFLALANTFIATSCVAIVPKFMGWQWVETGLQGPLAFVFAAGARWVIPAIIKAIPALVNKYLKLDKEPKNES